MTGARLRSSAVTDRLPDVLLGGRYRGIALARVRSGRSDDAPRSATELPRSSEGPIPGQPGSAGSPAPERAAAAIHRARVEGPAAALGPQLPPHVLISGELPGRPCPRLHRPLHAARGRGPGPVQRPRDHAAPGLRRRPHRSRQRPEPIRTDSDRSQGRSADQGGHQNPIGRAAPGLGRLGDRVERAGRRHRCQPGLS